MRLLQQETQSRLNDKINHCFGIAMPGMLCCIPPVPPRIIAMFRQQGYIILLALGLSVIGSSATCVSLHIMPLPLDIELPEA